MAGRSDRTARMATRALALALALLAVAPVALAADRARALADDAEGDSARAPDLARVVLALGADGRLRGELTMHGAWDAATLRGSGSGPPAAACLRLFTRRAPSADVADYLVCATPRAEGQGYRARVLRERRNKPPKTVGRARASRPTERTLYLRFARSAIGDPRRLRFAAEVSSPGKGCSRSLGCRDSAPDAPRTVKLLLRASSQDR